METPEPVPVLTPVPDNGLGLRRHALVCLLSILLSTHDFSTLRQYADKVILLRKTVLKVGKPEEVLSSREFQEVFHLDLGKGGV